MKNKIKISPEFKLRWKNPSSLAVSLAVCFYMLGHDLNSKGSFANDLTLCLQNLNYELQSLEKYIRELNVDDQAYASLKKQVYALEMTSTSELKAFTYLWNFFCPFKLPYENNLTKSLCSFITEYNNDQDNKSILLYDNLNPLAESFLQKSNYRIESYNSDFSKLSFLLGDKSLNIIRALLGLNHPIDKLEKRKFSAAFSFSVPEGGIEFVCSQTLSLYEQLKELVSDRFVLLTSFPITYSNFENCKNFRNLLITDHFLKAVIKLPKFFIQEQKELFIFLVFDKRTKSDNFAVIDLSNNFIDHNFSKKASVVLSSNVCEIIPKLLNGVLPATPKLNDYFKSVPYVQVNESIDYKIDPSSFLINLPLTDTIPLEAVADIYYGPNISTSKLSDPEIEHNTILELNLFDVPKTGIITAVPKEIYVKKGCTLKNEKFLRKGDIVFSVKGTIGKVGYFDDNRENVIPGQCFLIIRTKDEKTYPQKLLFSQLRGRDLQRIIKSKVSGKTLNVFQPNELKRLPIAANADKYKAQAEQTYAELQKINKRQIKLNADLKALDNFEY